MQLNEKKRLIARFNELEPSFLFKLLITHVNIN